MTKFQLNHRMSFSITLNPSRELTWKHPLDNDWTILSKISGFDPYDPATVNSVEIHRQDTKGDYTISGELTMMDNVRGITWYKKFSQFMKAGSVNIIVDTATHYFMDKYVYRLRGVVKISDKCENCGNTLKNRRSMKSNNLQSLELLSNHLKNLLETSAFADVTIKCDNASIPAHKIILSTRSPVFAAMFSNPMQESHKNEVDISDLDVSILRALLSYIYTGKINDMSSALAEGLLFAADKYQVEDLKSLCCDVLKDSLSLQNVLRILVLGELHAEDLKSFVVDCICKGSIDFSMLEKSEEWKTLRKDRPELVIDVLSSIVNYLKYK